MLRPLKAGLIALQYRHHLLNSAAPRPESLCARPVTGSAGRFRPLLSPPFFIAIVLILPRARGLAGRAAQWKNGLIAHREAAFTAPPVAAPPSSPTRAASNSVLSAVEGVFLHDKEVVLARDRPKGEDSGSGLNAAARAARPDCLRRSRLYPGGAQGSCKARRRPNRRHRAGQGLPPAAAGGEAGLVYPRQPAASERVVLGRSAGDERGGS